MASVVRISALTAALLTAAIAATPAAEASSPAPDPGDPRVQDAREYAKDRRVSLTEALRRLRVQEAAGELEQALAEGRPSTFAGLYIEHSPEFRVVVRLTRGGPEQLERHVAGGPLAGQVVVSRAGRSLAQLEAAQRSTRSTTRSLGLTADSGIDVRTNRVELYVPDRGRVTDTLQRTGRTLPSEASVIATRQLARSEANLYAGLGLSTCTTGFSVRHVGFVGSPGTGEPGVLTSGHCGNNQLFQGSQLRFKSEVNSGPRDVQWHTDWNHNVRNWAYDGLRDWSAPYTTGYREITATRSRDQQAVGQFVCKYGKTTGRTCGYISDRSFMPSSPADATATYIRVHADNEDLSDGGDSGGPWYNGGTAYGIHKCGFDEGDACYMAIDYIHALGLRVLTE